MRKDRGYRRPWLAGAALLGVTALLPLPWPQSGVGAAQNRGATSASVRKAPPGDRFGANPGRKGETYYAFEAGAVRVTARFTDAVAVSERSLDGDLHTTLADASQNELARLKFDRVDGVNDVVQYTPRSGNAVQAYHEPSIRATLHGNARQAYSLWKDRADGGQALEWQGGMMRKAGAPKRDLEHETVDVQTEWANGLTAKTTRQTVRGHTIIPGRVLDGDVLVTSLYRDGTHAGTLNWFPQSRVLMWNLPGLTKGYVAPEHLKSYGDWPFSPDMEWLNIQIAAFHQFKTQIDKNRFVARNAQPGWTDRILQFVSPTVSANEPGCDGLHWLDGTVFRFCCDVHDFCYVKNGCTANSWWMVWSSWRCDFCNTWVVDCFFDGGGRWDERQMKA